MLVLLRDDIAVAIIKNDDYELVKSIISDRFDDSDLHSLRLVKAQDMQEFERVFEKLLKEDVIEIRSNLIDIKSLLSSEKHSSKQEASERTTERVIEQDIETREFSNRKRKR